MNNAGEIIGLFGTIVIVTTISGACILGWYYVIKNWKKIFNPKQEGGK